MGWIQVKMAIEIVRTMEHPLVNGQSKNAKSNLWGTLVKYNMGWLHGLIGSDRH